MNLGLGTIIIAHTTFCLPFIYLMVSARVDEFDYSIIEASHDLGANEKQPLFKVIIPAIMPGIMSGFKRHNVNRRFCHHFARERQC